MIMAKAQSDFPLLEYLDGLVHSLRKLVVPALGGEKPEAIHQARVATRRLKAAMDVLEEIAPGRRRKSFQKITRGLRRQLGPLRDLDVMRGHLTQIKTSKFHAAIAWLKYRLSECRASALEEAREQTPPPRMLAKLGCWWGLHEEIAQGKEKVPQAVARAVHLQLDSFAEWARQSDKGDPHALRIAGKLLRYTLEMAREQGNKLPTSVLRLFKRMQESLGQWHDYVVLTQRMLCEAVECDLALHDPELQGQILALSQTMLRKAQGELKKMDKLWKEKGEELCRQIRQAIPLTQDLPVENQKEEPAGEETTEPAGAAVSSMMTS